MEKVFNLTSTFKSHTDEDGSIKIRGMASTADFDRAGDSISADAWTKGGLNNFEKNPIILFNHDYNRPIGRATNVKATDNGLELTAKISKAAKDVAELVKDGVLGAFSVGFRVKDADYIEETDGLKIKDAELFEVSVVSVPCNQSATFSLAKSFDSVDEYEDFKKTFTNSDGAQVQKEITMSEETQQPVDLEAFAKKVAEETAAKIAMKQAEQKAADEAVQKEAEEKAAAEADAKVQQEEEVKTAIKTGVESGADRLVQDMQKEFEAAKAEEINELVKKYEADVKEKADELEAMRSRKFEFAKQSKQEVGKEALHAKVLGAITKKGWDTDLGKEVMEKQGLDFGTRSSAGNLDITVTQAFEEEVALETKLAGLFREIPVTSGATVMPFAADVNAATFGTAYDIDTASTRMDTVGGTDGQYDITNNVLQTERLAAGTYIDNNVDETSLVSFLPMITSALARSHAVAIDKAILYGTSGPTLGIAGGTGSDKGTGLTASTAACAAQLDGAPVFADSMLEVGRAAMGKYAVNPADIVYVVTIDAYYDLLAADGNFKTVDKVGSDAAVNINGMMGSVYGSPLIVSAELAPANQGTVACIINTSRFVVGRLKAVSIETDYEVGKQRNVLVASQALGFKALEGTSGAHTLTLAANA